MANPNNNEAKEKLVTVNGIMKNTLIVNLFGGKENYHNMIFKVKDLLYKQMMLEKGNVNVTYTTSTEKVIDNKEKEESYSTEMYVDKDDVSDFDC